MSGGTNTDGRAPAAQVHRAAPVCLCERCPAAAAFFLDGRVYCAEHYRAAMGSALAQAPQGYEPPRMIRDARAAKGRR